MNFVKKLWRSLRKQSPSITSAESTWISKQLVNPYKNPDMIAQALAKVNDDIRRRNLLAIPVPNKLRSHKDFLESMQAQLLVELGKPVNAGHAQDLNELLDAVNKEEEKLASQVKINQPRRMDVEL